MNDENMDLAVSVDYALIAAISSLAVGLSKVKSFDIALATRTIDQYIKNPVNPEIPNRTAYEQVLENIKFQIAHPIECDVEAERSMHIPSGVVNLFKNTEEKE